MFIFINTNIHSAVFLTITNPPQNLVPNDNTEHFSRFQQLILSLNFGMNEILALHLQR